MSKRTDSDLKLALLAISLVIIAVQSQAAGTASPAPPTLALVPLPARLVVTGGAFVLGPKTVIAVTPAPGARPVADLLARRLRAATGYSLPVVTARVTGGERRDAILLTTAGADAALGPEGYALAVTPGGVVIRAPRPAGLFYGTQTLRQLLPPSVEGGTPTPNAAWRVPGVRLWDRPRFPVRGLMIDSSRHLQSVAFLKRTLDRMAYHKLNTFHWHLTDDQGWRVEIKRFPRLTETGAWRTEGGHRYGGFYTQAQVRDLVAYAAARFVTVVPEVDMPAHAHAALAAYPDLGCVPGPFDVLNVGQFSNDVLNPGRPGTEQFVDGVLTELMGLFPSTAIHIGGDECPKVEWKASPECQALMQRKGLKDEDALQNYFTKQVAAFLAAHGRRAQGWNEILRGGPLPQDVIVQQWNDAAAAGAAARAGHDVVVSLSSHVYFDAGTDSLPLQWVYGFEPMPGGLSPTQAHHILGVEACLWTETKPTDAVADEYLWPRLVALAEVAWSPPAGRGWPDFRARLLNAHYERLARMGVDTRPALMARSDFDWGVKVGAWGPPVMSESWKTIDWDVTPNVKKAGTYTLHLNYEGGADALAAGEADLLCDGRPVVRDVHDGWTGGVSYGRVYHFKLPAYDPNARYAVRVRLRSDGGTDSRGALWLAGPT